MVVGGRGGRGRSGVGRKREREGKERETLRREPEIWVTSHSQLSIFPESNVKFTRRAVDILTGLTRKELVSK